MDLIETRAIILGLILAVFVTAHPDGAPPEVCSSMIPGHGVPPQTSDPPYMLKTEVISGGRLIITIQPNKSEDFFRGFLLQVRNKEGIPVGEFLLEIESKLMDCPPGYNVSIVNLINSSFDNKPLLYLIMMIFNLNPYFRSKLKASCVIKHVESKIRHLTSSVIC